jgi:hypothetical protein
MSLMLRQAGAKIFDCKRRRNPGLAWSRTPSVSHGRQPPLTTEYRLSETAASRWLHALVGRFRWHFEGHSALNSKLLAMRS